MQVKLHINSPLISNQKLIGLLFLFLCCVFMAMPIAGFAGGAEKTSYVNTPLTQTAESEETSRSTDRQQECVISCRQKQKVVRVQRHMEAYSYFTFTAVNKKNTGFISSGLIRPAYYTFLFLYTLF